MIVRQVCAEDKLLYRCAKLGSWTMSESLVARLLYYMMAYQTMELMEGSDTVHIRNRLITMRDRERLGDLRGL